VTLLANRAAHAWNGWSRGRSSAALGITAS
jgi:hypothetical protein